MEKLIRIDGEVHKKIKLEATKNDTSIKDFVEKLVNDYLDTIIDHSK